jgi:hypothetical protein
MKPIALTSVSVVTVTAGLVGGVGRAVASAFAVVAGEGTEGATDEVAGDCEDRGPDRDRVRVEKNCQSKDHPQDCE